MTNKLESKFTDGDVLPAADLNDTFEAATPIGTIIAWHKDFNNTPTLPAGWAECNGQTLSNANSPYDGQTLPDLNGQNYFLRGASTSGATGGSDTHVLTEGELPEHKHDIFTGDLNDGNNGQGGNPPAGNSTGFYESGNGAGNDIIDDTDSNQNPGPRGSAHNNIPSHFDVVFIMRVA